MKSELLNHFGSDATHVDVARVSFGKHSSNYTDYENARLINYLAKNGHTSPFRHTNLQFRISCPVYVERQIHKHQIGVAVNSISGRYVDFSDNYYQIEWWRKQAIDSKQGSGDDLSFGDNLQAEQIAEHALQVCKNAYNELLKLGVSKEQARSVLPLSLETEFIWTGSFQAFIHLCNLRTKKDTQKETRDLVNQMLRQVKELGVFNQSLKAFGY